MIGVIRKIRNRLFKNELIKNELIKNEQSIFNCSNNSTFENKSLDTNVNGYVTNNSTIQIGENCKINCTIYCQDQSEIIIKDNIKIENLTINCRGNSKILIEDGVIFDSLKMNTLYANNGKIIINNKAHIKSSISAKFGGKIKIGTYTDIGEDTEIRAEEEVIIGNYCLFSYNINIFDTNTHSTDWEIRRSNIINAYPNCFDELQKPKTKPIYIGNDVWLGKNVVINKGANIGNRVIVGINTVVSSGDYPDDCLIVCDVPRVITKK